MVLLVTDNNPQLVQVISKNMDCDIIEPRVQELPSGEIIVRFDQFFLDETIIFINTIATPIEKSLIRTLFFIDTLRRAKVKSIHMICPYLAYLRGDRLFHDVESFGAKLITKFLSNAGIDSIAIIEPHFLQVGGFFDIPTYNIMNYEWILTHLKQANITNYVLIAPDAGAAKRTLPLAIECGQAIYQALKYRNKEGSIENITFPFDIKGKNCIIVDDIIDTGRTLFYLAEVLASIGVGDIYIYATHGLFSGNFYTELEQSKVTKVIVTNTIEAAIFSPKIEQVCCSNLVEEYIGQHFK